MTSSRTTVVQKRSTPDDSSTAEERGKRQKIVEDEAERGLVLVSGMNAVTQKRGRRDEPTAERLKRPKIEEDGDFACVLERFKTLGLKEGSSVHIKLQVKDGSLEQEGTLSQNDLSQKEGTLEDVSLNDLSKKGVRKKGQKVPFPPAPILYCPCGAGVCRTRRTRTGRDSCRTFFSCPAFTGDLRGCAFLAWRQDRFKEDGSSVLMDSSGYLHHVVKGEDRMTYKRCFRCRVDGHLKEECRRG